LYQVLLTLQVGGLGDPLGSSKVEQRKA